MRKLKNGINKIKSIVGKANCMFPVVNNRVARLTCIGTGLVLVPLTIAGGVYFFGSKIMPTTKTNDRNNDSNRKFGEYTLKTKNNTNIYDLEKEDAPKQKNLRRQKFYAQIAGTVAPLVAIWEAQFLTFFYLKMMPLLLVDYFSDTKNIAKMISQSDQCCVIIRKTSMATIKVPYYVAVVVGSVLIGYGITNITGEMILYPYGKLGCVDNNIGPSANIMAHDWI